MGRVRKDKPYPGRLKRWLIIAGDHEVERILVVRAYNEEEAREKGKQRCRWDPIEEARRAGMNEEEIQRVTELYTNMRTPQMPKLDVFDIEAITQDRDWEHEEVLDREPPAAEPLAISGHMAHITAETAHDSDYKPCTQRGFRIYHEDDRLRVSESSCIAAGDEAFMIYPVRIYGGIEKDGHVHLSHEQAKLVRAALDVYIQEADEIAMCPTCGKEMDYAQQGSAAGWFCVDCDSAKEEEDDER